MTQINLAKAGLLSPKTLREEIVRDIGQMEAINGDGRTASASSEFPVINLDAPEETYFTIGGAVAPMDPIDRDSESPLGTLGDIEEDSISTSYYSEKLMPEKETDAKLNSEREALSLFRWAAMNLRTAILLARERYCWQGDSEVEGLIGQNGDDAHDDIPSDNVLTPSTSWSDTENADPYGNISSLTLELQEANQTFFDANVDISPRGYFSPRTWHDLKNNDDMKGRFDGVEIRRLNSEQVERLIDDELPEIRIVEVQIPRTDNQGNYLDEEGNIVDKVDDAAMDNVLEPYDPQAGEQKRCVVVGKPGASSAFQPWFEDNVGPFDDADAPGYDGEFALDETRGFATHTKLETDPETTVLRAFQDVGFHLHLPDHWGVIQDI